MERLLGEADRELLPLRWKTPDEWADTALADPLALLDDHAHLERKAAINALDLLLRWPGPVPPENWVQAMTGISIDEVSHLQTVTRLLARRGGRLTRWHANPYASELHKLVRRGRGNEDIIDRLIVSALIEARSCERFCILAEAATDEELRKLYAGLWKSEAGHYRVFLGLAKDLPRAMGVDERWEEMLAAESEIVRRQKPGPRMHGGV